MHFSTTSAPAAGPDPGAGTAPSSWAGMRRRSRAFDALGLPAVALDRHGRIVAANAAWAELVGQGEPPIGLHVGDDYRVVGATDAGPRDRLAERRVAAGLAEVVGGRRALFEVEVRWPSALEERWFLVRAAAAAIDDGRGAVVVHLDITARKHLEERIGRVAGLDPTTGLPDEGHARDGIARRLAGSAPHRVTVTVVALHGVDDVHAALGAPAADRLLVQVIARVRRALEPGDLVCRLGPGELGVVGARADEAAANAWMARLRGALAPTFDVAGHHVALGVVVACRPAPTDATADALLADARTAAAAAPSAPATRLTRSAVPDEPEDLSGPDPGSLLTLDEVVRARTAMLDAIGEAVLALDLEGRVTHMNRAAEHLYGWSTDAARGRTIGEIGPSELSADEERAVIARVWAGGSWSGDLVVTRRDGRTFGAQVTVAPLYVAGQVSAIFASTVDVSSRLAAEAALTHQVSHDRLTGLANRAAFTQHLEAELASGEAGALPLTVVLVDLDDFQQMNRSHGLPVGDHLLRCCATALGEAAHPGDVLSRFSGDSFAVCCAHQVDGAAAARYADDLRAAAATPIPYADGHVSLRSSAGIGQASRLSVGGVELLRRADTALLNAKADQRTSVLFDPEMDERARRQVALDRLVRATVDSGVAPLAYQAITRFEDRSVVGAEALLRVTGADGEPVPPMEVFAAADRCGLSIALGALVLRTACEEAARWQRYLPERYLTIAVNLSPDQFRDPLVADAVRDAVRAADLEPSRLALEVSESILMEDTEWSARQLAVLKMQGVKLSADDYGTGHTSLLHLKRFPLDSIKVDLSLVAGLPDSPEDLAIVAATMGVADALDLRVVAEGVENERQLAELHRLGCQYGQGFLWSSATSGEEFLGLVVDSFAAPAPALEPDRGSATRPPSARPPLNADVEELDTVMRSLVHEIRTPLTVAMGYASLLEASVDEDQASVATSIRLATERINRLLGNLEDVRQIDQGTLALDARRLDLHPFVEDAIADLRRVVHVNLVVEHATDGELVVDADELRIGQVLINLVSNAAKFVQPGSPVVVRVEASDRWAEVSVSDDGPGIAQEDLGLIYRKYGRGDRAQQGTGLGLYLARGTARAHGGDIVYRRGRPGSTFTLTLPRRAGA